MLSPETEPGFSCERIGSVLGGGSAATSNGSVAFKFALQVGTWGQGLRIQCKS